MKRKKKFKLNLQNSFAEAHNLKWSLLIAVTAIITVLLYPNLIMTKHNYIFGDVAERDIKAPRNFLVEDKEATQAATNQAVQQVLTVYDFDDTLVTLLVKQIQDSFGELRSLIESKEKQKIPKDAVSKVQDIISTSPQSKEGDVENPMDQYIQESSDDQSYSSALASSNTKPVIKMPSLHDLIWQKKEKFEKKISIKIKNKYYSILEKEKFSKNIESLIIKILQNILNNGVVSNKKILLNERNKGIVLKTIASQKEIIVHDIERFYGLDQAKTMIWIIAQPILKDLNYNLRDLIVDLVQSMIQPNITLNKRETEDRRKKAAQIKPILFQIKDGEMLLREGERISKKQILKLKALQEIEEKENAITRAMGIACLLMIMLLTFHIIYFEDDSALSYDYNKNILFMSLILIFFVFITDLSISLSKYIAQNNPVSSSSICFGIPVAAGAMTICLFLGIKKAIPFALITAVCVTILFRKDIEIFIYFFISCIMGAYWIRDCRERNVFIKAGFKIGLLNFILITALRAYAQEMILSKLLWDWVFGMIGGLSAGILTAGIAPFMEIIFGYTTDIKLLELSNLERPLLRQLMLQAPGTYHHSVVVGSLVEAAASEIGANPLLAKVCGYYHDIGKIKKPLYFIENQTKGNNRHDKLAPSMSSLIIIAHVKHGMEIAKKYKLGKAIVDTIQQHHGTSHISFFYEKAKQLQGQDSSVNEDDFRYPGPKPQTKEAALVMLADIVEATSRTLDNPTPARIQGVVQRLINKVFSDGQLSNCELTLKDLHKIAKSYNKILTGIHHHRIEYTDSSAKTNGKTNGKAKEKADNGNFQKKQTNPPSDKAIEKKSPDEGQLKRLGL
ncbi:cyclic-di-AMP phosphodiesterase PgpH [Candidatus Magnetomoraceae bacterium gMMP-15]